MQFYYNHCIRTDFMEILVFAHQYVYEDHNQECESV